MFYVEGPFNKDWHVVIGNTTRDLYNMPEKDSEAHVEVICGQNRFYNIREDKDVTWDVNEILGISIDSVINNNTPRWE